jgi:hypothetical protein
MFGLGAVIAPFEKHQHPAKRNTDAGEKNVKTDIGGKLNARQQHGVEATCEFR